MFAIYYNLYKILPEKAVGGFYCTADKFLYWSSYEN